MPIGVLAQVKKNKLLLEGVFIKERNQIAVRGIVEVDKKFPKKAGVMLAEKIQLGLKTKRNKKRHKI